MCNDKMYYLFAGNNSYPNGGVGDFMGTYQTLADAVCEGEKHYWWHVTDDNLNIVEEY